MSPSEQPVVSSDLDSLHGHADSMLGRLDQRYTRGRRNLLELLARAGRPITLPQILDAAPEMPQSSVYRNLDVLERIGLISRITIGTDHAHFELAEPLLGHHHHLICVRCGTITDIHLDAELEEAVDAALATAAGDAGFTASHHSLDLHGKCADCMAD